MYYFYFYVSGKVESKSTTVNTQSLLTTVCVVKIKIPPINSQSRRDSSSNSDAKWNFA